MAPRVHLPLHTPDLDGVERLVAERQRNQTSEVCAVGGGAVGSTIVDGAVQQKIGDAIPAPFHEIGRSQHMSLTGSGRHASFEEGFGGQRESCRV